MGSVVLSSILSTGSFGEPSTSLTVKQIRIAGPEYSFSNSFGGDFAIGQQFRIDKVAQSILNGSILSLEAFGNFLFPPILMLPGITSKEALGLNSLDYLYLYAVGTVLYTVEEAKYNRLEKVAIKNVIVQKMSSSGSISGSSSSGSPYRTWNGDLYSIIYEDTLERYWEEDELTSDPESFFDWYSVKARGIKGIKTKNPKPIHINSLGRRKKNVDWGRSKLFSRRMAEKGVLQRIKVRKARIKKGNMLVYFDDTNTSWEEDELVFETMAIMLVNEFKSKNGGNK